MQESQDPAQPRGCIATSYLTLYNFSTSTGIVNITKRQIYAKLHLDSIARIQSKKIYLCAGNAKVINGEVAVLADNMADNKGPVWQWQITPGARCRVTAHHVQF